MEVIPTTTLGRITRSYGDGFYAIQPLGTIKGVEWQPIPRVPMCQLGNISVNQIFPFNIGDVVPISFLSFSQSNFLEGNDEGDLDSDLTNSFADCIAFPFVVPTSSNALNALNAETITINGNVEQSGTITNDETISNGIALTTHVHGGITKGSDKTEKAE